MIDEMNNILKLKLIVFILLSSTGCAAVLWTDGIYPLENDKWRYNSLDSGRVKYEFGDMIIKVGGAGIKCMDLLVGGPIIPFLPFPSVFYDNSNSEVYIWFVLEGPSLNINPSTNSLKIYLKDKQKNVYPYKMEKRVELKNIGIGFDDAKFNCLSYFYYFQIPLGEIEDFDLIFLEAFNGQTIPEIHFNRKKEFEYELRWIN